MLEHPDQREQAGASGPRPLAVCTGRDQTMFSESDVHSGLDAQVAAVAAAAYQSIRDHGLVRRPPYLHHHRHDLAAPAFYPFEDVPCTASVYEHCAVVEPSAYLYNVAATSSAYDYGSGCPDCCERSLSDVAAKSSGDDELAASPSRRASRKRSLSQAELERRRSLANHQERRRMHRLNSALDRLRSAIPARLQGGGSAGSRRLSKIRTLKMAIDYIGELQALLGEAAGRCWD